MQLSDATFRELRDFIYERTGILFQDNKKYLLESRLLPRLRARNCTSFEEYCKVLRFDAWHGKELNALFSVVTTNETYFYRDMPQLEAFMNTVLPAVMDDNQATSQLRMWSAGCSTGDEPYTLAIMLLEHAPLAKWSIEILATDISETALHAARKGVYGPYAVRNVPPAILQKYFTVEDGQYVLSSRVKHLIKFANVNLYDRPRLKLIRGLDVIFCRNCLIYFDDRARRQVLDDLYDCLKPNGYLVIGFSESLHNLTRAFQPVHANRSVVYRKA
ncbi:MAG TPA: protein-glutamate O-methyltransferase CheR [Nitrospiraceae bacterium]|jgi:chemotaxis protein methyltransferase CheR|nr:protein-glutamate O-methyltransferase CheR [Nitrospiraceae bacterium]